MSHWHSLSVFGSVVEEGSFSAAAKKLELTQPTVSFHIDNLEKFFGCSLFQRTSRGVNLTVYGETLLRYTSRMNSQLEVAQNHIKSMLEGSAGKITFGASTIPAEYIVPSLIAEFLRSHPDIQFSMQTGDTKTILGQFENGAFPIAIIGAHPGPDYTCFPLLQDEMVLVAHPAVASGLPATPELSDILSRPFISRRSSSASMRSVQTELEHLGVSHTQMRIVLEVGGNEALKSAIINQVGLGFISKWAIQEELKASSLKIINIPGVNIARQFYVVCREPLIPTCFRLFWDYLIDRAAADNS